MASSPVGLPPGFQIVGQAQGQPQGPQQAPGLPPGFQVVGRAQATPQAQAPQANEAPDNLPDLPSVQAGKQPQGAWSGFVSELGDAAKGALKFASDAVSGLGGNPAGAVSAMQDASQGNVNELNRAGQEFKQGNYIQGAAHGAAGLLPGVGPAAVQTGENLGAGLGGDRERLGRGIADAAMLGAPEAIKESGAIPRATGVLRAITKEDPRVLAAKAWTPTPQQTKFLDHIEDTGAVVKNYGNGGVSPKSNEEAIAAIDRAKKPFKAAIQKWVDAGTARGATIDGREIVKATRKAMSSSDIRENPDASQAYLDAIEDAYGHPIPVAEAYRLLRDKNANLTSHFNKREGAQISANIAGGNEGLVKAQRDAIQKSLYQALDPQGKGAGPKQIQQTLHNLIDFKNTALARKNQAVASRPASVSDAIKGAIPKAAQALHSPGMGYIKSADLAHPSTLLKGTVDPVVQRFFDSVGDRAKSSPKIPLPPAPKTPSGPQVKGLLPPPSQIQQPGFSVLGNQTAVTSPVTNKLDYVPGHYAPGQIPASETLGKGVERRVGAQATPGQEQAFQALRGPSQAPHDEDKVRPDGIRIFGTSYSDKHTPDVAEHIVVAAHPGYRNNTQLHPDFVSRIAPALKQRGLKPENVLGTADFTPAEDGSKAYYSASTSVDEPFRRKGVMSDMYDHAAKQTNSKIVPASVRSDEGTAFWKRRNFEPIKPPKGQKKK